MSKRSLGSRIEAFIKEQRTFSDELQDSSPRSVDSPDKLEQVIVDPDRGLILNVDALADPDDEPKPKKPKKKAAITEFFNASLSRIQSSSAAAYAAYS